MHVSHGSFGQGRSIPILHRTQIMVVALPATGGRIVIASDGLFGFVTTEVAASIVSSYVWPEDAASAN